jgi:prepilin-type N-terminal cleavage/methylation domain-containing protein
MGPSNVARVLGIRGFSLIEVVIAIGVLMTASLGFMMLLTHMNKVV